MAAAQHMISDTVNWKKSVFVSLQNEIADLACSIII